MTPPGMPPNNPPSGPPPGAWPQGPPQGQWPQGQWSQVPPPRGEWPPPDEPGPGRGTGRRKGFVGFMTSLPGVLTAVAGLVTAVTGGGLYLSSGNGPSGGGGG